MGTTQLPNPGDLFLTRYRIEKEVGKGGFSVVYKAIDQASSTPVAVKVLVQGDEKHASTGYDRELVDRFLREARLLEQLDNPHTLRMFAYGEAPDGSLYMVTEFIDGLPLFDMIKQSGAMPPSRVARIVRQALVGLQSAHQLGILHRDIKPNNIMVYEKDGDPDRTKLVDFGIAKTFGEAPGMDLTAAGLLVGTPRYMSPEQLKGQALGPPSDVYSLGLCAIEMLTGRKCIPGKDRMKIIEAQLVPTNIPLDESIDCPPGLRRVVERMVEKDLRRRYGSAAEAVRDLEALAGDPGAEGDTVFQTVSDVLDAPLELGSGDSETALQRVNTAELDAAIAHADTMAAKINVQDLERTVLTTAEREVRPDLVNPADLLPPDSTDLPTEPIDKVARHEQHRLVPDPRAKPHAGPTMPSYESGIRQSPLMPQSAPPEAPTDRMGAMAQPDWMGHPTQPTSIESLGLQEPPRNATLEGPRPPAQFGAPATKPGKVELTNQEMAALALSFFLPGTGHVLIGQQLKGLAIFGLVVITCGIAYILSLAVVADAYLVIRAKRSRAVEPFEFFPDYKDFL